MLEKKKHRAVAQPPFSGGKPGPPSAAASGVVHVDSVAPAPSSSTNALRLVLAGCLGLALLLLALAVVPVSVLPERMEALIDERRDSLIVGALACVAGIAVGLLIAVIGS